MSKDESQAGDLSDGCCANGCLISASISPVSSRTWKVLIVLHFKNLADMSHPFGVKLNE